MDDKDKRITELEQEISYLKNILDKHNIHYSYNNPQNEIVSENTGEIIRYEITPEMARFFYSVFKGRKDVYARRASLKDGSSGYFPVCENFWKFGLCPKAKGNKIKCGDCENRIYKPLSVTAIIEHLKGSKANGTDVIGIYPLLPDDTCNFLVFDFDDHSSVEDDWMEEVDTLRKICKTNGVDILTERSRSGNGAHIWIFFEKPISAALARKFGTALLDKGSESVNLKNFKYYDRMLPLQDSLPKGGLGNLIALPLQGAALANGNSAFVDKNWLPYSDQWKCLKEIHRISKNFVEKKINEWSIDENVSDQISEKSKPWEKKKPKFHIADISGVLEIALADCVYINKTNLKPRFQNQLRRIAAYSNPEFYKNLALGYSNYDTPRIVYRGYDEGDHICLPRGCFEDVISFAKGAEIRIEDKRQTGRKINIRFKGQLYTEQLYGAKVMLNYDIGVMSAATAFGKTVVGAYFISERKVNTLILVRNTEILKIWQEDLEKFLETTEEPPIYTTKSGKERKRKSIIGILQGNKNSLTGIIDIAMITSLGKNGDISPIVKNYGMVIVDECHHAGAVTDENVLCEVTAKYVYGLTATPKRDDGQEKKIFMQLGPIRFRYTAKDRAEKQGIGHFIYPRFTRLIVTEKGLKLAELNKLVIESEIRNLQIINDAAECVQNGRTPLIMTKQREHAQKLYDRLKDKAKHVFLLQGGNGAKARSELRQKMLKVPENETMLIVATGQYIGEGFNYPRLDTLLLAMPISWSGNVEQYAGRLNRDFDSKKNVIIYDYIDGHIPMLERMYQKRLRTYKKIGFDIYSQTSEKNEETNSIFGPEEYAATFERDIRAAKKRIIVSSPYTEKDAVNRFIDITRTAMENGVKIYVLTFPSKFNSQDRIESAKENIRALLASGIAVDRDGRFRAHYAVIDDKTVWYGSINLLSSTVPEESIMRIEDEKIAAEVTELAFKL